MLTFKVLVYFYNIFTPMCVRYIGTYILFSRFWPKLYINPKRSSSCRLIVNNFDLSLHFMCLNVITKERTDLNRAVLLKIESKSRGMATLISICTTILFLWCVKWDCAFKKCKTLQSLSFYAIQII